MKKSNPLSKTDKIKILDADTTKWSKKDKEKIKPHLKKYSYQVNFQQTNGKVRYAYCNDPIPVELYLKSQGSKILKVLKL